jgi:hypothetical protein
VDRALEPLLATSHGRGKTAKGKEQGDYRTARAFFERAEEQTSKFK